ncbi:putative nuclease HARBI1 [Lucilia cuprina]|nr:putative nuclease HARBI1 [Lucilia cuprina]
MDAINPILQIENLSQISKIRSPKIYKERTIRKIVDLVKDQIIFDRRGSRPSPDLQVKVALRCWGRGEFQDNAGDLHGLTQSTVSRICERMGYALASLGQENIKMPESLEEEALLMRDFKLISDFPGVIGAIDGTHIRIKKTGGDMAEYYTNRRILFAEYFSFFRF